MWKGAPASDRSISFRPLTNWFDSFVVWLATESATKVKMLPIATSVSSSATATDRARGDLAGEDVDQRAQQGGDDQANEYGHCYQCQLCQHSEEQVHRDGDDDHAPGVGRRDQQAMMHDGALGYRVARLTDVGARRGAHRLRCATQRRHCGSRLLRRSPG